MEDLTIVALLLIIFMVLYIIFKINTMTNELEVLQAQQAATNTALDNIAVDIQTLNDAILAGGTAPTPEQWTAVTDAGASLQAKAEALAALTPDPSTPEG